MTAEQLYRRNLEWAFSIKFDLTRIHSKPVIDMLNDTADHLLLDAQTLSIGLRTAAAFHEDLGSVLIANAPQRAKSIVEFNLLVTNVGTGKSAIINSLIQVGRQKRLFDHGGLMNGVNVTENGTYRHGTVQEFTGPGILKALGRTGNLFIVIDEFDGNHHQSGMFPMNVKNPKNSTTSANSIMKSLHTGVTSYQKAKVTDKDCVREPHVCFLAASNGAPIIDIIKYKVKNPNTPDAMVMRTVFDAVKSPPKFNAMFANKQISESMIGWEFFLLASSLLTNQTYLFQHDSIPSANTMMLNYMDSIIAAASRWDNIDPWICSRFAKTCELAARFAAQLTHIDVTMELLKEFIEHHQITDCHRTVSYERYCLLRNFIHHRYPPSGSTIVIEEKQVEAAIYLTNLTLLKYLNLFNTDLTKKEAYYEVPWVPPESDINNNATGIILPSTPGAETSVAKPNSELLIKQLIMTYESITFTRTMLYKIGKIRSKNILLDSILNELVESKLLVKFERGVLAANTRTDLYVKCLPPSLTQNTTNQWVKENLDRICLSWPSYVTTCSTIIYPCPSSIFSIEVTEFLDTETYKKLIVTKVKPFSKAAKSKTVNTNTDSCALASSNNHNQSKTIDQENLLHTNDDRRCMPLLTTPSNCERTVQTSTDFVPTMSTDPRTDSDISVSRSEIAFCTSSSIELCDKSSVTDEPTTNSGSSFTTSLVNINLLSPRSTFSRKSSSRVFETVSEPIQLIDVPNKSVEDNLAKNDEYDYGNIIHATFGKSMTDISNDLRKKKNHSIYKSISIEYPIDYSMHNEQITDFLIEDTFMHMNGLTNINHERIIVQTSKQSELENKAFQKDDKSTSQQENKDEMFNDQVHDGEFVQHKMQASDMRKNGNSFQRKSGRTRKRSRRFISTDQSQVTKHMKMN